MIKRFNNLLLSRVFESWAF